jgi:hypothetical protein
VHPLPNSSTALTVESNQSLPGQAARVSNQTYAYDRVFAASETQEAVYASVSDLIDKFLQGYFVTIFAYGQTSSGKSYTCVLFDRALSLQTMNRVAEWGEGFDPAWCKALMWCRTDCIDISEVDEDRLGITPRVVAAVFKRVAQMQDGRTTCTVKNSYLELYQEELYGTSRSHSRCRSPVIIVRSPQYLGRGATAHRYSRGEEWCHPLHRPYRRRRQQSRTGHEVRVKTDGMEVHY